MSKYDYFDQFNSIKKSLREALGAYDDQYSSFYRAMEKIVQPQKGLDALIGKNDLVSGLIGSDLSIKKSLEGTMREHSRTYDMASYSTNSAREIISNINNSLLFGSTKIGLISNSYGTDFAAKSLSAATASMIKSQQLTGSIMRDWISLSSISDMVGKNYNAIDDTRSYLTDDLQQSLSRIERIVQKTIGRTAYRAYVDSINLADSQFSNWFPTSFAAPIYARLSQDIGQYVDDYDSIFSQFLDETFDAIGKTKKDSLLKQQIIPILISVFLSLIFSVGVGEYYYQKSSAEQASYHREISDGINNILKRNAGMEEKLNSLSEKHFGPEKKPRQQFIVIRPIAIRKEPSALSDPITFLHKKQIVRYKSKHGKWTKVEYYDTSKNKHIAGWIPDGNLTRR